MTASNTRKFSDKIALLEQQQLDGNRAFDSIINEVHKEVHKIKPPAPALHTNVRILSI
jgi:hypothetical protein